MPTAYFIAVTIHVLAALVWLGGMFFLALVGAPVLRTLEPALRQRLFTELGTRARNVGWWAIAVLVVSGTLVLHYRGWLRWDGVLAEPAFWATGAGRALAWKLGAVAVMLVVSGVHDFLLGPLAGHAQPGSPEALRLRCYAALLARASAIIGIVIVIAAVRLARGG